MILFCFNFLTFDLDLIKNPAPYDFVFVLIKNPIDPFDSDKKPQFTFMVLKFNGQQNMIFSRSEFFSRFLEEMIVKKKQEEATEGEKKHKKGG